MNSCILMAQIVSEPELRSTQDQTQVSTMIVEFESTREGEAPGTLQVEGWGKVAEEMKGSYHSGDQVVIEGRLSMVLIEQNGYKEKKAKLVASRIHGMGVSPSPSYQPANNPPAATVPSPAPSPQPAPPAAAPVPEAPAGSGNEDWDEIPF
ncbi:MAG: single-stranded DNA-binding protein [Cyanobacteria bacterium J06621_8]